MTQLKTGTGTEPTAICNFLSNIKVVSINFCSAFHKFYVPTTTTMLHMVLSIFSKKINIGS
jgi:hypothetical protein